jgi:hypothetical protein
MNKSDLYKHFECKTCMFLDRSNKKLHCKIKKIKVKALQKACDAHDEITDNIYKD